MRLLILFSFLLLTNFASATNPITVDAYQEQFTSEESGHKLAKWWRAAKASIKSISNWALYSGILAGLFIFTSNFIYFSFIYFLGLGLLLLSLILGSIVLLSKNKTAENYKKARRKAIIGILISLIVSGGLILSTLFWWGF